MWKFQLALCLRWRGIRTPGGVSSQGGRPKMAMTLLRLKVVPKLSAVLASASGPQPPIVPPWITVDSGTKTLRILCLDLPLSQPNWNMNKYIFCNFIGISTYCVYAPKKNQPACSMYFSQTCIFAFDCPRPATSTTYLKADITGPSRVWNAFYDDKKMLQKVETFVICSSIWQPRDRIHHCTMNNPMCLCAWLLQIFKHIYV